MFETQERLITTQYTTFLGTIGYKYVDLLWYISNNVKLTTDKKNKILEMYREWYDNYRDDLFSEIHDNGKTVMNLSDIYWVHRGVLKVIDTDETYNYIKIVSEKVVELTEKDIDINTLHCIVILNGYVYKWLIQDGDINKLKAI